MREKERFIAYKENLEKLLNAHNEDNFVIFTDTKSKNFIQFILNNKDKREVLCDMPSQELDEAQGKQLLNLGFEKTKYSYIAIRKVERMYDLTETIFTNILKSNENFDLVVELNVENSKCEFCGKEDSNLDCFEIYLNKIYSLNISQDRIEAIIDTNTKFQKQESEEYLSGEELKMLEAGNFDGLGLPLFVMLCSSCKKLLYSDN